MSKYCSDIDIYSKEGTLLLAKGQELTGEALLKLKRLGAVKEINVDAVRDEIEIFECASNIKDKFNRLEENLLNNASDIISDFLFDSKSNSWWMYVNALSNYVDWVYTHTINVALISLIIAIKLNYAEETLKVLCLGALLHDVGKLLIPKNILQKQGKLSDREMILVKQHCELGYSMIKDLDLSPISTEIILQHHERLDGSGYPYGLHSDQISDGAKIVMIADVLDAITSYRPYSNSQQINVAMEELKKDESKYSRDILDILESFLIM